MTPEIYPHAVADYMRLELAKFFAEDEERNGAFNDLQRRNRDVVMSTYVTAFLENPQSVAIVRLFHAVNKTPHSCAYFLLIGFFKAMEAFVADIEAKAQRQ